MAITPARLLCCAGLMAAWLSNDIPRAQGNDIESSFIAYADGRQAVAIDRLRSAPLTAEAFTSAGNRWIASALDQREGAIRQQAAAAFALELVWSSTRTPDDVINHRFDGEDPTGFQNSAKFAWQKTSLRSWKAVFPVIAWACTLVPRAGPVEAWERDWWHASVAMLEDAQAWHALTGGEKDPKAEALYAPGAHELVEGHLAHVRARVGDVPWVRMADALSRTAAALLHDQHDDPWLAADHVLRDERERHPDAVNRAMKAMKPLLEVRELAAEAGMRLGRLELRQHHWSQALQYFESARSASGDPWLLGTVDYLAGWAHEQSGHAPEAVAAYRRAREHAPQSRNLAVRLSALLYEQGDRAEAYALLDAALHVLPPPMDLVSQLERGDGHNVPAYLSAMRSRK